MGNPTMTKNMLAEAAIAAFSIVKFGAGDELVTPAVAAADGAIGVVEHFPVVAGERCDVVTHGFAEVKLGGAVTRGGAITAGAAGVGVAAAATNRAIGFAWASGVAGDVIPVQLAPHTV